MNNLSWFLYAVDVLGSLGAIANMAIFVACVAVAVLIVSKTIHSSEYDPKEFKPFIKIKTLIKAISIVALIAIAVPSTKTMYLILGSEIGEEVIQSETAKKVHDAVNKKLDEYLGETE